MSFTITRKLAPSYSGLRKLAEHEAEAETERDSDGCPIRHFPATAAMQPRLTLLGGLGKNLLAVLSEASGRLAEIEAAAANSELLQLIDEHKSDYADSQQAATKAETALESICRSHPEWFVASKSIKTPYGKVAFRTGTSLEVKDDESTVRLLRALRPTDSGDFIRTVEVPNVEALEALDDAELGRLMVKRVGDTTF